MGGIGKYLQETQAELRHVAWPTRTQTIVYAISVALLSVGIALYLGVFDFIFTTALSRALSVLPARNPITVTQNPVAAPAPTTGVNQTATIPTQPLGTPTLTIPTGNNPKK